LDARQNSGRIIYGAGAAYFVYRYYQLKKK
jgi:hypothetical protein